MILADKIVSLRKKAGWSQEDLAEKLGVTRQSVSKWEGAQSVPDMDKVVMMSRLFGVSTDFLLKDELEEETPCAAAQDDDTPLRRVTMKQASAYLALRKAAAPKIAIATALCIISPVTLILLAGMSEVQRFPISGNAAAGIGLCVMLVLLAVAVSIFLRADADVRDYRFLEEEPFETEYGVEGMVRQRQQEYKDTHTRLVTVGVVLCVLAAVPLFAAMCISGSDLLYIAAVCALLVLVAVAVVLFMQCGAAVKPYEFLEKEPIDTEYGVTGLAHERRDAFAVQYNRGNTLGTVLCILCAVPLFAAMMFLDTDILAAAAVCLLLVLVACGVYAFVRVGTVQDALDQLLEEGDFTRDAKARKGAIRAVAAAYWLVVVAIFLFYTFGPYGNGQPQYSWFIWAIAGVIFAAVMVVMKAVQRNRS